MNKQSYGYFNGKYFTIHDGQCIYVPDNVDYKSSAIQTRFRDNTYCEIESYMYHSDLITECNTQRVAFMKDFLINEKIKELLDLNEDYIVSVEYVLYNNDGKVISSGTTSVKARYYDAIINSDVREENILEYRKAMIFDSRFEIRVPIISSYGIKKPYIQHPYTLKINKFIVSSTVGENKYVIEADEQITDHGIYHSSCCQYNLHHENHMLFNDYSSHFLTNAHTGSTIIDQMVVPAELQIPPEYTEVVMCEIPCEGNNYLIKIDQKVDSIFIDSEIVLDNSSVVYNKSDIDAIIESNNNPVVDEDPIDSEPELPDSGDTTETTDGSDDTDENP